MEVAADGVSSPAALPPTADTREVSLSSSSLPPRPWLASSHAAAAPSSAASSAASSSLFLSVTRIAAPPRQRLAAAASSTASLSPSASSPSSAASSAFPVPFPRAREKKAPLASPLSSQSASGSSLLAGGSMPSPSLGVGRALQGETTEAERNEQTKESRRESGAREELLAGGHAREEASQVAATEMATDKRNAGHQRRHAASSALVQQRVFAAYLMSQHASPPSHSASYALPHAAPGGGSSAASSSMLPPARHPPLFSLFSPLSFSQPASLSKLSAKPPSSRLPPLPALSASLSSSLSQAPPSGSLAASPGSKESHALPAAVSSAGTSFASSSLGRAAFLPSSSLVFSETSRNASGALLARAGRHGETARASFAVKVTRIEEQVVFRAQRKRDERPHPEEEEEVRLRAAKRFRREEAGETGERDERGAGESGAAAKSGEKDVTSNEKEPAGRASVSPWGDGGAREKENRGLTPVELRAYGASSAAPRAADISRETTSPCKATESVRRGKLSAETGGGACAFPSLLSRMRGLPDPYPSLTFSAGMSAREITRRQQKALGAFLRSLERTPEDSVRGRLGAPLQRLSAAFSGKRDPSSPVARTSDASTTCSSSYSLPANAAATCPRAASPALGAHVRILDSDDITFLAEKKRDALLTPKTVLAPALAARRAKIIDILMNCAAELQTSGLVLTPDDLPRSAIQLAVSLLDRSNIVSIFEEEKQSDASCRVQACRAEQALFAGRREPEGTQRTQDARENGGRCPDGDALEAGDVVSPTRDENGLRAPTEDPESAKTLQTPPHADTSLDFLLLSPRAAAPPPEFPRPRVSGNDPEALKTIAALCLCTALQFETPNSMAFERKAKRLLTLSHLCSYTFNLPFPVIQRAFLDRVACVVSVPVPIDFANYFLYKFDSAYMRKKANSSSVQLVAFLLDCFSLTPQAVCTPSALAGAAAVLLAKRICENKKRKKEKKTEREEPMWTTEMKNITGFDSLQVKKVLKTMNAFLMTKRGRFPGLHKLHTKGWAAVEWEHPGKIKARLEKEERRPKRNEAVRH
ncbi:hypothetical protein BESB_083460 [Besnoitia besnoiti]|uniref:Cyclin C-terminal domain-containing protein n=1 Tax=Besnoitia besnoiti TaxID=94643 RepID=A0A2A9MC06_BESBE|nr:hypothetical protein BESB_083460 [Besnoitia besnoiti]PFH33147.1 hypothetical protein BESB_083460 [Besnoitia besnoiti]